MMCEQANASVAVLPAEEIKQDESDHLASALFFMYRLQLIP